MEVVIIAHLKPTHGNLYHNSPNQLRRAVGKYDVVCMAGRCGTIRDGRGKCWDWWETEERIDGTPFFVVKVVPAT